MDLNEDALRLVIANLDKKSSARLAQTCCSMSEEALNGLWATVEWSDVLCMARSLVVVEEVANASSWGQTGQGGWGVPGNVTPTNTDRVDPVVRKTPDLLLCKLQFNPPSGALCIPTNHFLHLASSSSLR